METPCSTHQDKFSENPVQEGVLNFIREIPYGTRFHVKRYKKEEKCNQFEFVAPSGQFVYFRGKLVF